jgi:hypothetical protein
MQKGYSDRINHAFAFAAKHHDSELRKGLRASPYFTQPANVAVILTRYGRDDVTVLAGILHDLIASAAREGRMDDPIMDRISAKFGAAVLETALAVVPRKAADDGVEFSMEERRADLLQRLQSASDRSRWVLAAVELHEAGSLLADLARTQFPEVVWERFPAGRDATVSRFRSLVERLREVGFDAAITGELSETVARLGD